MGSPTQNLGQWGENIAAKYLASKGFVVLKRHFTNRFGEIDIIASQGKQVVFVEVKLRLKSIRGEPEQSINFQKQERLKKAIAHYVSLNGIDDFRIDVIALSPGSGAKKLRIKHHQAQFSSLGF